MFFFTMAGYETSSTTSAFSLLLLSLHTTYQERLHNEIDKTLGHRHPSEWTLDDFQVLFDGYLGAIVKETLRLYGPVEWLPKRSIRDVTITDISGQTCLVPKDTTIVVDFPAMFRHPQYWPGQIDAAPASQFKPEIWLVEKRNPLESVAYYPFSGGRRACPGRRFAEIQMAALLARIFVEYSVEFVPSKADIKHAKKNGLGQNWIRENAREQAVNGLYDRIGFSHGIYPKKHQPFRLTKRTRLT
jgi:cytochrome P450